MTFKKSLVFIMLLWGTVLCSSGISANATTVNPDLKKLKNPTHTCSSNAEKHKSRWSCIYFGSYPKSIVTDTKLQAAIDAQLIADKSFSGKAKYVVGDCVVDGVRYRKIRLTTDAYKSDSYKDYYVTDENRQRYMYFRYPTSILKSTKGFQENILKAFCFSCIMKKL